MATKGVCLPACCMCLNPLRPVWAEYCDQCYWVDSYKRTYVPEFNPLLGPDDYEKTAKKEMIQPPVNIRKTGRLRGKKIRAYDEPESSGKKTRKYKRCKEPSHYEKTCAGGAVGSNPKVRTCVDGDTYTAFKSGQSNRNKKAAKIVHGSSAGESTSVRGGKKTNFQSCVGESSRQDAARSAKKGEKERLNQNLVISLV
ncbi:uncharacterized protein LOC113315075 [Papaver somniferum]|uniref:uncharacterized protein LOC113315075 n=1 Tax=Papaver somniferum TaxID=3469 RepID=UPI000E705D58|nr:uncharacterized protein LOC113315075 [Papaver somniferum]XP_026419176.1 uncharacterized protein LOC113315075 [Papaver somniferum]XP_026419177.1 uncharacterized protein LOC113315075 [Papaver somniferum]